MQETILTNANLVLPDRIVERATLVVRDRLIHSVDETPSRSRDAMDLDGDYLLPGLIELHTDNLEKHFVPRPGTYWPSGVAAVVAHDVQILGAGITTVCDAVCVGNHRDDSVRRRMTDDAIDAIAGADRKDLFRTEHFLHLRCEVSDPGVVPMLEPHLDHPKLKLVSVMDHTPGQGQFCSLEIYRRYNAASDWTDAQFDAHVAERQTIHRQHAGPNRARIVSFAKSRALALASHDDTTEDDIRQAAHEALDISEFPTSFVAAQRARDAGMKIVMGAPNLVRGGSHSGNVEAATLARAGLLDVLSSDYVPASLLQGVFVLHLECGLALPEAVATATTNPAAVLKLDDRGRLAPDLNADLIRVRLVGQTPIVCNVWRHGQRMM